MRTTYTVKYRRKREGKTDYKARRNLLASRKHRFVVRKSLKYITVQIVDYTPTGDNVLLSTSSKELVALGWKFGLKNTCAAYLTGLLAAKKAKDKKITTGVVDLGRQTTRKGSKLFAVIKGISEGGVDVGAAKKLAVTEDRIEGKHIASLKDKLGKDQFKNQNTSVKDSIQDISKAVAEVKKKITQ